LFRLKNNTNKRQKRGGASFGRIKMNELQEHDSDFLPPNPIRVETALSRYPVHRLAKHGEISIDIREKTDNGEITIRWEVTYNSKYGQPGPLAYKLDTLLINRRIEEARRPIPRLIRLGSLHEICRELGISEGENKNTIKKSLYQNAGAFITAKTCFRQSNGTERTIEFGDTRYGVVFTGETLPDGRTADAVYIILHDFYMDIINNAITRPLDYGYLKSLPPAPQRFYELLSYQMYAAIKNDRSRAKLLYSNFCTHAPQTRYASFDQVKKQMFKIHKEHRKSGYIVKIDFEQTIDADGIPDWIMLYQPGPKAKAEFRAFTKRGGPVMLEVESFATDPLPSLPIPQTPPLVAELVSNGVTETVARQLVAEYDEDKIQHQIEILGWLEAKKPGKISDSAAWLVIAIKNGHATPKGFVSADERRKQQETKEAKARADATDHRRKQEADAQERREKELVNGFWDGLSKEQKAEHEAAAIAQADAEELKLIEGGPMKKFGMTIIRQKYARKLLQSQGKLPVIKA
jgi:hypothetical protein